MSKTHPEQIYVPQENETQLTVRAVLAGSLLGGVVSAMNIYLGLRTGWTFGGSIIAAILSYSLFQVLNPKQKYSVLETNIAQTSGSAAGYVASTAGMVSSIPAMKMLGYDLSIFELFAWAASVSFLGVFFAVPLRQQLVVSEKLRFPTGTATAETIVAVFAEGAEALRKSRVLLSFALFAGLMTLASYFVPALGHPPVFKWIGLGVLSAWGFSVLVSPIMFGAGMLVGPRIGSSLFLGALLGWGLLGPMISEMGWVSDKIMDYKTGPRGWLLWPGVALMVGDALTSILFSYKSIINTFINVDSEVQVGKSNVISTKAWCGGLLMVSALIITTAYYVFDIAPLLSVIAIVISGLLSMIATRSLGETDINPTGGMGKITQMVFGGLSPGNMSTNLMAAGITSAGSSQAADMMQDLKSGYLLGATPNKQFKAQCCGIFFGIFFAVPIYKLFDSAYTIGEGAISAPAAQAWKAMAEVLSNGFSSLPQHSVPAVAAALALAVLLSVLKQVKSIRNWVPSAMAMGIAFIIPAYYAVAMFVGAMFLVLWKRKNPVNCEALAYAVASGLLAGEGLMGVVTAILTILGVKPLF